MTERAHMDRPAAAIAILSGVIIIAASLPFAIFALPDQPTEYLVGWPLVEAGQAQATVGDGAAEASAQLSVQGYAGNVTVAIGAGACQDSFDGGDPYRQQPATFGWRLAERAANGTEIPIDAVEGLSCADVAASRAWVYAVGTHPDIGSLEAHDMDQARLSFDRKVAGQEQNTTYVLTVTWSRAPAQPIGGLPIGGLPGAPQPSFDLTVALGASKFEPTLAEAPEVGK